MKKNYLKLLAIVVSAIVFNQLSAQTAMNYSKFYEVHLRIDQMEDSTKIPVQTQENSKSF